MDSCLATVRRPPILTYMMGIDGSAYSGLSSQGGFPLFNVLMSLKDTAIVCIEEDDFEKNCNLEGLLT